MLQQEYVLICRYINFSKTSKRSYVRITILSFSALLAFGVQQTSFVIEFGPVYCHSLGMVPDICNWNCYLKWLIDFEHMIKENALKHFEMWTLTRSLIKSWTRHVSNKKLLHLVIMRRWLFETMRPSSARNVATHYLW